MVNPHRPPFGQARPGSGRLPANADEAEVLALQAFGWISGQDAILETFLAASGAAAQQIRERLSDPGLRGELLVAVLDFLMLEDGWIMDFCAAAGYAPQAAGQARALLPGGQAPEWT